MWRILVVTLALGACAHTRVSVENAGKGTYRLQAVGKEKSGVQRDARAQANKICPHGWSESAPSSSDSSSEVNGKGHKKTTTTVVMYVQCKETPTAAPVNANPS